MSAVSIGNIEFRSLGGLAVVLVEDKYLYNRAETKWSLHRHGGRSFCSYGPSGSSWVGLWGYRQVEVKS